MPKKISFKIGFLFLLTILTLAGCSVNFKSGAGGGSGAIDGGGYKSLDKGTTWLHKSAVLTVGAKKSIAELDIISLAFDPQDNKAVYAGSQGNGLFYSYDAGEGWQLAPNSANITITNIAVDPANKCVIYASSANRLFKSTDCSRTWSVVFFGPELKTNVTALAIDYADSDNVFIGTARGEIIKSSDQGASWQTLNRFDVEIKKIIINPADVKSMFVLADNSVHRSTNYGSSWDNLKDNLKSVEGTKNLRDLIMVKGEEPVIFLATKYSLLKSTDLGGEWTKIELITLKTTATINAIAANPNNIKEIYYVTNTTFFRSLDGGVNWTTKKLPTNRAGFKLLVDPKNPRLIYLTTKQLKK